jgi:hypothetical protein
MTTTQAATNAAAKRLSIEQIVQLMEENTDRHFGLLCEPFARAVESAVLASLVPAGLASLGRYGPDISCGPPCVGTMQQDASGEWLKLADVERWAASHAGPAAEPTGWKLVPVEPTPEMCAAPSTVIQAYGARLIYERMLAAAPAPAAAPSSADVRAAGSKDATRLEKFIDWYLREGKRSEIHPWGHVERTTRAHIMAWLDASPATDGEKGEAK